MQHLEGSGTRILYIGRTVLNPLNVELNPICNLLALLGAHLIFHVSRIRVQGKAAVQRDGNIDLTYIRTPLTRIN